jgi:hypothetical protein
MAGSAALPYSKQTLSQGFVSLSNSDNVPGKLLIFTNRKLDKSLQANETQDMIELFA